MSNLTDSYREIVLDGIGLSLVSPLNDNNTATFQRRLVIGEAGLDSNPLLSALVMSNFSGGNGVEDINESTDTTRYLISSLYTRYPKMISKPYRVYGAMTQTGVANTGWRYLGDLKVAGVWTAIMTGGTGGSLDKVVYSVPYGGSATSEGTLTAAPVNKATVFRGSGSVDKLFIPMGASGYATVDADGSFTFANVAADATHPELLHAEVLGYELVGIDVDGVLWSTTDGATWAQLGATANLSTSEEPKRLIQYFDRNGQPALFVLTDMGVKQLDRSGPILFEVDVSFAPHPYAALAGTKWNGDLYFSVGMGIYRYTGGSLAPMGLDRDSGLPHPWLGTIVDLVAGEQGMYALVAGTDYASIHEYTQSGWHMIWEGTDMLAVPRSMGISRAGDQYSLYWGVSSSDSGVEQGVYRMDLPNNAANPRNLANLEASAFASGVFRLTTGIYDMGMTGYTHIASAIDVTIGEMPDNAEFTIYYRLTGFENPEMAEDDDIVFLDTIRTAGVHHIPFGVENAHHIHPGVSFQNIQFMFQLTDSSNDPFILESAVLGFVKTLPPSNSWTAQIDFSKAHSGLSPQLLKEHIDTIMAERRFVSMVFRGETYRVMIAQSSGTQESGTDERGARTLTLLEVPEGFGA